MGTVMVSSSPSSAPLIMFRRLLRPNAPFISFSLHLKHPLCFPPQTTPLLIHRTSSSTRPHFNTKNSPPFSSNTPLQVLQHSTVEEIKEDVESNEVEEHEPESVALIAESRRLHTNLQSLTVKEKKELASYAHSLGKNLKSQQVGKSGITDTVVSALVETLEKNELLKLKIHGSCPEELEEAIKRLEESTGSIVVGQIGRTVILYRPSLSKLKAEEKKKITQRAIMRKQTLKKPVEVKGLNDTRPSNRGRRGSSRF